MARASWCPRALGISSALELKDSSVCVTQGTTTELNLQDFSNQNDLNITPLTFEDTDAVLAAYENGQCDSFTNDNSQLAALGTALSGPGRSHDSSLRPSRKSLLDLLCLTATTSGST